MDSFELPVAYKGQELSFRARLVTTGFAPRFVVLVNEVEITFERDDNGEFRALLPYANEYSDHLLEKALLQAIHASIVAITS
jgi:hypothetical protein